MGHLSEAQRRERATYYRQLANDAEMLARMMSLADVRDVFMKSADHWRSLADEAEKAR